MLTCSLPVFSPQLFHRPNADRLLVQLFIAALVITSFAAQADAAGWVKFTNANPGGGTGTPLQLTDGTIMVQAGDAQGWTKLMPDSTGSYANGTWSNLAAMSIPRLYFGSNVMTNGKVFVLGGEYSGAGLSQNITNTGEIYDPVQNKWTATPNFPRPEFGDDPTILLSNGKILCGYIFDGRSYLYNPATNSFSQTGTKLRGDRSDEETWVILPNGKVLSYDIFASDANQAGSAQMYDPLTATWSDAGSVPAILSGPAQGYELGPASMLPDGRVIVVGANENIVLYNPASNTWAAGPSLPAGMGADDAPGALLPNGHFVFLADSYLFKPPTKMYDFDYKTNTLTDITSTLPVALQNDLAGGAAYFRRMMIMPNGHLMLGTNTSNTFWDFAPTGSPDPKWAPTITGITKGTGANSNVYTLTGARLCGISQGASYGDDVESDTNYPLIRLSGPTPGTTVKYATTSNWTPGVSSAGAPTTSTVQFTLPAGLANGTYKLAVVASGMASTTVDFTIPFVTAPPSNYVAATYVGGVLKLTDDAKDNSVLITMQGTRVTVQGAGNTVIGTAQSNSQQVTFTVGTSVNIDVEFVGGGNNSVSISTVKSGTTLINFGSGNDKATLTYCTIGDLTVNGGAGTDSLTTVGTTIPAGHKHVTSVP